jgi:hypothetical protein
MGGWVGNAQFYKRHQKYTTPSINMYTYIYKRGKDIANNFSFRIDCDYFTLGTKSVVPQQTIVVCSIPINKAGLDKIDISRLGLKSWAECICIWYIRICPPEVGECAF